jgi:hypothetical protein
VDSVGRAVGSEMLPPPLHAVSSRPPVSASVVMPVMVAVRRARIARPPRRDRSPRAVS